MAGVEVKRLADVDLHVAAALEVAVQMYCRLQDLKRAPARGRDDLVAGDLRAGYAAALDAVGLVANAACGADPQEARAAAKELVGELCGPVRSPCYAEGQRPVLFRPITP